MLNLKPPESSSVCDPLVERSKRPRDDSDPWNVAWHQIHIVVWSLGDNKVVINWTIVFRKSRAMSMLFLCVVLVDQFVRWFLGGAFRPRTDENDWCRHIFRESNKAAGKHVHWLMVILDLERSGWRLISTINAKNHVIFCHFSMGPEGCG